ncbi:MAG: hypothetical protein IIW17_08885, partial [Clostridia bacterium]|nr:hypothetical protein [Clostridia bacterium]
TSPKMKIEQQYVQAYTDSLLNSKDVMALYRKLDDITCNGDQFNYFLSYWKESGRVNEYLMRAVTAWAMLKKDERLFWLLSWYHARRCQDPAVPFQHSLFVQVLLRRLR